MAKRYIRINWQNRPSVATPISATNLNKMDKGIDDCDNAIEEIYNKRVNNVVTTNPDTFLAGPVGKTLQDQITTLNNNLASQTFAILSESSYSNANDLPGQSIINYSYNSARTGTPVGFTGGTIITFRNIVGIRTQLAFQYNSGEMYYRTYNSAWLTWRKSTDTTVETNP